MKSIVRVAVLVAAFATAGCVSNAEVAQVAVAAAAETTPVYGDMHAATPFSKVNG
jgi:outer membrane murein-binding lipoprotein Lpp